MILHVADRRALPAMPALAISNAPFFQMYSDNTQDPLSSDSAQPLPTSNAVEGEEENSFPNIQPVREKRLSPSKVVSEKKGTKR